MSQTQSIEKHGGYVICRDPEDGYFWRNGPDGGGYFDTLQECRDDIDDYNDEEREIAKAEGRWPDDTPSLAAPWWEAR